MTRKKLKARKKLKVRKFKGGGMDASKADFKTPSSKKGPPANIGGNNNQATVVKNNVAQNIGGNNNPVTKTFRPIPITPFGLAAAGLMGLENIRRAKHAKGERLLSGKKTLPATRDFYRQTGRPLNTKIGSPDEQYLKDAGIIGKNKPPPNIGGNNEIICPVGYINQNGVCVKITGKSKGGFTKKYYKGLL